ncbi:nitroreductase family protein [Paenibacillus xylaniclasticus]|uniref:nitroreductase family protein n=1 Tax=Paenibacillus xylaniclasticus TaxID=588083 RepID=UPI000FD7A5D3|nr:MULTISPECIES: nitroreductase family protein [Paenibacillus]GFN30493.1 NAD(P)H nitroreductase [Paenibacillus curdlanolyticus]
MSTTNQVSSPDFQTVIRERHSVRKYDPTFRIPREELIQILQEATLAPSSSNLQPWRFLVIDDQSLKEKLLPIAFNQQQVVDASHVIAVLADKESYRNADTIYSRAVEVKFMDSETKERMVGRITGDGSPYRDAEIAKQIGLVDAGLISMQFMLAAKAHGYDTVPMGGFNKEQFNQMFNIPERYETVMLIAVGKAAVPAHASVRLTVDEVTFWNEIQS